jgi:uncharacterized Zn finger protein (UPF0148 family)
VRNDDHTEDYPQEPPTRCCGHCGTPLFSKRRGARYCDRRCKELAREARKRASQRLTVLRRKHPLANASLNDLYEQSRWAPGHVDDDESKLENYEFDDHVDDGPGIPWKTDDATFNDRMALAAAIEAITAKYDLLLRPYRDQVRRNTGVKPVAMARLEAARDGAIRDLIRKHDRALDLEHAARDEPRMIARAAGRQLEQAALAALARDLPGRSRRYEVAQPGRDTRDIAAW